jgi:hypothetical protein
VAVVGKQIFLNQLVDIHFYEQMHEKQSKSMILGPPHPLCIKIRIGGTIAAS